MIKAVVDLIEIKKRFPNIILRIIALSDGEDNSSHNKPNDIAKLIIDN